MKRALLTFAIATFISSATLNAQETTTLVYPAAAADTELDNSTPAKRITPPIREETEYDPVTPLGQIRAIIDTLNTLETQQSALIDTVGKLRLDENNDFLPILERGAKNQDAILDSTKSISAKIDALQTTMADLRATVESVEKTAASVERIRTSRWTDYAVVAILALVLTQLIWRVGSVVASGIKRRAAQYQEFSAFIREKQLAEKESGNK